MPAAYIAAGAGLLGGLFGKKKKSTLPQVNALYKDLFAKQKQFFGQATAQQNAALNTINAGYGDAMNAAKASGFAAKQSVLDNQQQLLGKIKQNAVSTGMFGSSVGANQVAQAGAMSGKNLAAIDTVLGQLLGNLNVQKANAVAGQQNQLGNLAMQQAGMNNSLGVSQAGLLGNYQYQNNTAGMLGEGLGGLAAILFGGTKGGLGIGGDVSQFYNSPGSGIF